MQIQLGLQQQNKEIQKEKLQVCPFQIWMGFPTK